jgi:hypothetical protein
MDFIQMPIARVSMVCSSFIGLLCVVMTVAKTGHSQAQEGATQLAVGEKAPLQVQLSQPTEPIKLSVDVNDITPKKAKKPDPIEPLNAPSLLKYGLSIGLAAAFTLPSTSSRHGLGVSAMPYVAVFPVYWFGIGEETREYCAAHSLYMNHRDAQRRADALARFNAEEAYNEELTVRNGKKHCKKGSEHCAALQPHASPAALHAVDFDELDAEAAVEAYTKWTPGTPARCLSKKFGAYFGIPTKFTTGYGDESVPAATYPKVSFGAVIAPAAYVNLLLGVTYGDAEVPPTGAATKSALKSYWQFTVSLGGTADIVGTLVSKLGS